jgi:hypothetical protein
MNAAHGELAMTNATEPTDIAVTHLSLQKDALIPRAVQTVGHTLVVPILGGLHHQYIRA